MAYTPNKPFNFSADHPKSGQFDISSGDATQRQPTSFVGFQRSTSAWPAAQSKNSPGRENPTPFFSPPRPSKLSDFFILNDESRSPYSDWDVLEISRHLREAGHHTWSEAPRLYTVLRVIGQLQVLDRILEEGTSDIWFPFNASTVPKILSSSLRAKFLEIQALILTKGVDLEKKDSKGHTHFGREDSFPFEVREKLGKGGSSTVDKIFSPFSRREFARKRFLRGRSHESKGEIQSFRTELQVLKRIEHHHCVELVASYTDTKYFGLILSPVADCNLAEFYNHISEEPENLNLLRQFYGCLATGLQYLHSSKIRHRDIKPENILIKNGCVYLADFGISLDWDALTRSTTTEDTGKSWIYCAPEVANYEKRNSSSDIWSLGCVFLEMCSILKGRTVNDMRQYFKKLHDTYKFFQCFRAIRAWSEELCNLDSESDNVPLYWAAWMMHGDPNSRPSANDLCDEITRRTGKRDSEFNLFCGECCYIGSDADSSHGSASGGDLWAENLDDEITSPATSPLTSPMTTDSSKQKPESGAEDTIIGINSNHLSSTGHPTAVQKALVEPEIPTVSLSGMPTEAHARTTEAIVTETYNIAPDLLPVTAYQEAVESIAPQESVTHAGVRYFRAPIDGHNFQAPVESPLSEAFSFSGRTNVSNTGLSQISEARDETTGYTLMDSVIPELGRGLITIVPDEMGKDSNSEGISKTDQAFVENAMNIDVQPLIAVSNKSSVTASASGSRMTTPYPLVSKARMKQTLIARMPDDDILWGQKSNAVVDNDRMESPPSGGMLAQEDPERTQTIQPLPDRPPPIPPNIITEHRRRIERSNADGDDASVLSEKSSTIPDALSRMKASEVISMPQSAPIGRATSASSSTSLAVIPNSPKYLCLADTSGLNGIGERTDDETQTNSSREVGKEGGGEGSERTTRTRSFPFIKAESWHSPGQFIGDVIKDSALIQSYGAEDLSRLISEKDPQSITTLVDRMIGDGLPINTNVYTEAKGHTPLDHVLNWGDGYQALFKLMVDAGALIDKESEVGLMPLFIAAGRGHLWAVKYLVGAGVSPNTWPPLIFAAQFGHLEVVKYLIEEASCSLNQEFAGRRSAILSAFVRACKYAQLSVVKYSLENHRKSIYINARYTDWDTTSVAIRGDRLPPIMHAYFNEQPFPARLEVIKVLLEHGADPNGGQEVGTGHYSLLHVAASKGEIELVKLLLKYRVKISTRTFPGLFGSFLGCTPVSVAKENGHMEIVRLLQAAKTARKEG